MKNKKFDEVFGKIKGKILFPKSLERSKKVLAEIEKLPSLHF